MSLLPVNDRAKGFSVGTLEAPFFVQIDPVATQKIQDLFRLHQKLSNIPLEF